MLWIDNVLDLLTLKFIFGTVESCAGFEKYEAKAGNKIKLLVLCLSTIPKRNKLNRSVPEI